MVRIKPRQTASRSTLGRLLVLLLAITCLFAVAAVATPPSPQKQQQKGETKQTAEGGDLICHTDVAAECYPRLFQATDEFQRVHEDQDLPPGLHVRLNVYTGEREAKLNNDSDEPPAGLAGLPVDQSIVLVDQPELDSVEDSGDTVPLPRGAPAYDPVGLVKKPEAGSGGGGGDAGSFYDAIAIVKGVAAGQAGGGHDSLIASAERARFAGALEQLDEFAHDIYYGVKLAEDHAATRQLLCLMSGGSSGSPEAAQKAAAIVGAAVQNNPTALLEVEKWWDVYTKGTCVTPGGAANNRGKTTLGEIIFGRYHDLPVDRDAGSAAAAAVPSDHPAWVRSRLLAINGLIKSDVIMKDFLASDGLTEVLRLLVEEESADPAYEAARTRAAHLVNDNFLDASMGADVSLWPELKGASDATQKAACGKDGKVQAHCWSYHIQQLAKAHAKDQSHWSHELRQRLEERESGKGGRVTHGEL